MRLVTVGPVFRPFATQTPNQPHAAKQVTEGKYLTISDWPCESKKFFSTRISVSSQMRPSKTAAFSELDKLSVPPVNPITDPKDSQRAAKAAGHQGDLCSHWGIAR